MTIRPSLREVTIATGAQLAQVVRDQPLRGPDHPGHVAHAQLVARQQGRRDPQPGLITQRPRGARHRLQPHGIGQRGPDPLGVRQVEAEELAHVVVCHGRHTNACRYV